MEFITVIQIIISITLPVWLYLWLVKQVKAQPSSSSHAVCSGSDVHYLLKRWWAEWCIGRRKKKEKTDLASYEKDYQENARIIKDEDGSNSVSFYGTDQKGNSLFVKFACRRRRMAEVSLQLTTSNGGLYVLPGYPNTVVMRSLNQEWSAVGLKIELLHFPKRWRLCYNGMLRNLTQNGESSNDNVEHVRLNFVFMANSKTSKWPNDWSTKLHAEALACQPWRGPQWINTIKSLDYQGCDHWGSLIGLVTFKDSPANELYLRGMSQCRWGKHESHEFSKTVTIFGSLPIGAMFYVGASSTKHSFPRIQFGEMRRSNEMTFDIDETNLNIDDFTEAKCAAGSQHKLFYKVGKTEYNVTLKPKNSISLHSGQPWNWTTKIISLEVELNGKKGVGTMQLSSPYTGPCEANPAPKIQYLKQPNTHVQPDDYVVYFSDGKCHNENIVGGKGFSLAALTSIKDADFTVPEGFCVTVFALDLQLQTHKELQQKIDDIEVIGADLPKDDVKKRCEEIVSLMESTPVVEPVKDAIRKAIENLEADLNAKGCKYAIRSSAVGEDSEETSAAGQNSTYLGITGVDNIVKSVGMCWASLFSCRSVEYRKQHGLLVKSSMGVCIQRMVDAEAAGVMFTRHPTTGDPSNIIITTNYGLGETVVSAMVEPDTITIHRGWDDKLTLESSVVGNKTQKISMKEDGVATITLDEQERQKLSISENIALRLAAIGVHTETVFGSARDIEWAVTGDKIYLLQARPITTLHAWTDFEIMHELDTGVPADTDILTTANVDEVFPKPLSPLSISVVIQSINRMLPSNDNRCTVYVNAMKCTLNYFNAFGREVGKEISMFHKMSDISVCGEVVMTPEVHKVAVDRNEGEASNMRGLCGTSFMLLQSWKSSEMSRNAEELHDEMTLNADDFHSAYSLYNEIDKKMECITKVFLYHTIVSGVSIASQGFAMVALAKGYEEVLPDHLSDIALILSSCNDVISMEVPVMIEQIASCIRKSDRAEEFKVTEPSKGIGWLKENCPPAAEQLDALLKKHGHRCMQEMDIFSEPWSLNPDSLIIMIQAVLKSSKENNLTKTLEAEEIVSSLKTPKSSFVKWFLRRIIPFCKKSVMYRERTKSAAVGVTHKFKLAYRKLGKLMVSEGYLFDESLVFFLLHHEIGQLLNNRNPILLQRAFRRKKLRPILEQLQYPHFSTGMPMLNKPNYNELMKEGCTKIEGTIVCTGSILARACVIMDISQADEIQQGDILITHSTDICWSPYFPLLSGLVTELGGLISHGAVVAREYGLPCIVGAKGATQVFQTGDTVLLSGDTGVLQMIKRN